MVRLRKIDICLSFNVVTSLPASRIEPDVGFSNPVTRLSKVLLPFPDLPTIANEFAWIEREIHVIHRGERFASAYEFTGKATNLQIWAVPASLPLPQRQVCLWGGKTHRCGEGCDQARKHGEQGSDDYQYRHFTDANLQIRQLKFLSDQTTERKHDQTRYRSHPITPPIAPMVADSLTIMPTRVARSAPRIRYAANSRLRSFIADENTANITTNPIVQNTVMNTAT